MHSTCSSETVKVNKLISHLFKNFDGSLLKPLPHNNVCVLTGVYAYGE